MAIINPVQTAFEALVRKVREAGLNETVNPNVVGKERANQDEVPQFDNDGWHVLVWKSSDGQQFRSSIFRHVV